jgi:hypothetical protein
VRGLIGDRRSFPVTHLNWIDPCGDDFWHPAATSYELPAPGTVRQSRETSSKAVVPGNGKPFPDGSKMAKVGWKPKKSPDAPYDIKVPGAVHDVDFMVKDTRGSRTAVDGDMECSSMTPLPICTRPQP